MPTAGSAASPRSTARSACGCPTTATTVVHDVIRGDTTFAHVHLDDPVIARADGSVLYNFAVAVDDVDGAFTHVVRGEDHLSNTPKQLLVMEAMGAEPPLFAHMPLLHGPDGKKLSKRHGAASVQELRAAGYLPEAVRNYLALLGWGDPDDETILGTEQLVERFDITRVSHNPARFDEQKLRWLNGRYIRALSGEQLTGPARAPHRPQRPARRRGDLAREDPDARGLLAARRVHLRRAGRRPDGAREVAVRRRRRRAARRARGARRRRSRSTSRGSSARCRACSSGGAASRATSTSRCAWRSRARRCRPGIFETLAVLGRDEALRRIDAALRR